MSADERRPWFARMQQDVEHPFRAAPNLGERGGCADCLGGPDAPAHVRAAERAEFAADMVEIEGFGEVIFNALDFMADVGMPATILAPPRAEVEMGLWLFSQLVLLDDVSGAALDEWRASRAAA